MQNSIKSLESNCGPGMFRTPYKRIRWNIPTKITTFTREILLEKKMKWKWIFQLQTERGTMLSWSYKRPDLTNWRRHQCRVRRVTKPSQTEYLMGKILTIKIRPHCRPTCCSPSLLCSPPTPSHQTIISSLSSQMTAPPAKLRALLSSLPTNLLLQFPMTF